MKTNNIKILAFFLIIPMMCAAVRAQRYDASPPLSIEKTNPNVLQISGGVSDFLFSPSGKLMLVQMDWGFYVLPTERLDEAINDFENSRYRSFEGQAKGFLPSDKILYAPRRGLYAIDPQTFRTEPIYQMTAADEENGNYLADGYMVAVSENLIVSGDGEYDMGLGKGNILLFDVKRRRVRRGAQINGFFKGWLSPTGKYVLYENRGELATTAAFYDIGRNLNYPLPLSFNFKRHFPKYKKTDIFAHAWVGADRFIATVDQNQEDEEGKLRGSEVLKDTPAWLVLFDAASRKIVWKTQLSGAAPVYFEQLSTKKALFDTGTGLFEISLADGNINRLPPIDGSLFVLSPQKKQLAFVHDNQIFVSLLGGAEKQSVLMLPESWQGKPAFDGKGIRSLSWSPDGKRLLVFDENRLLIVRL